MLGTRVLCCLKNKPPPLFDPQVSSASFISPLIKIALSAKIINQGMQLFLLNIMAKAWKGCSDHFWTIVSQMTVHQKKYWSCSRDKMIKKPVIK